MRWWELVSPESLVWKTIVKTNKNISVLCEKHVWMSARISSVHQHRCSKDTQREGPRTLQKPRDTEQTRSPSRAPASTTQAPQPTPKGLNLGSERHSPQPSELGEGTGQWARRECTTQANTIHGRQIKEKGREGRGARVPSQKELAGSGSLPWHILH